MKYREEPQDSSKYKKEYLNGLEKKTSFLIMKGEKKPMKGFAPFAKRSSPNG